MITLETLAIINKDLENGVVDDSRPERSNLELISQQTDIEAHSSGQMEAHSLKQIEVNSPGQIEENFSEPSIIIDRKAMQPPKINANNTSKNAEATDIKEIYEKCMKICHFFAVPNGVRLTYDWKPHRYFLFFSMCFALFFSGFTVLYTVYVHYVNGRYLRILEPLAVSGIVVSCCLKTNAMLRYWQQILALIFVIRKYIRLNVHGRQAEIIKSSLRRTWTFLIVYTAGVIFCLVFYASVPITVYLVRDEVIPLLPVEVIFCDQSQRSGFVAATIVHFLMGYYAAVFTLCNNSAFIFSFYNYILFADLIAEDFQELDGMWNGGNNISVEHKRAFLKNICRKRMDMNNYLGIMKEVFETQCFIYFCSSYFSEIICLYDITQNDWIGGYAAAFLLFFEMVFYCYMGTQVSIVDDKLCYTIYNNNWYMYDLESQRMVLILLHESQQSKDIQLGTLGPLNLMTGVVIVKSIYSYYTVLTELF